MKKIYQQPELFACEPCSANIIALSQKKIVVDPTKTVGDDAPNYVKESYTDDWSDDW